MMNVDTEQPQYSGQAEQEGQDVIWESSPLPSPPPRPLPSLLSSPLFSSPPPLWPPPPQVYLPTLHFDERGEQNVEDRPHSAARYPGHHADESSAPRHVCVQFTDPIGREVNETNFPEIFPAGEEGTIDPQLLECDGRVIDNLHGHNSMLRVSPEKEPAYLTITKPAINMFSDSAYSWSMGIASGSTAVACVSVALHLSWRYAAKQTLSCADWMMVLSTILIITLINLAFGSMLPMIASDETASTVGTLQPVARLMFLVEILYVYSAACAKIGCTLTACQAFRLPRKLTCLLVALIIFWALSTTLFYLGPTAPNYEHSFVGQHRLLTGHSWLIIISDLISLVTVFLYISKLKNTRVILEVVVVTLVLCSLIVLAFLFRLEAGFSFFRTGNRSSIASFLTWTCIESYIRVTFAVFTAVDAGEGYHLTGVPPSGPVVLLEDSGLAR
ncbi:hypothetical protein EDB81DRAFT_894787 [Dactylonectria macrodidyma]|uniref:Uncharacterized protein n=1 Tax=Dactylonectria macrodidyma TaxID=307937 RepID=A0A9P9D120_9HYPO|nr:hypothetical protein EDB81DRAFT_894787 [Dactylonectria macrodidyma]